MYSATVTNSSGMIPLMAETTNFDSSGTVSGASVVFR